MKFILERYKDLHERTIPIFLEKVSNHQERNDQRYNPVKWLLWHMIRGEDFGINRLIIDEQQIYQAEHWDNKIKVDTKLLGTGMTKQEVYDINKVLNLDALNEYRKSVYKSNCAVIRKLDINILDETIRDVHLKKVLYEEGLFAGDIDYIYNLYKDKSKGWLLLHTTLTHNYYHLGQIALQLKS